jgi:hypothetical protein
MYPSVTHDIKEESPEAKVRWFSSLPLSERMELLCSFSDLILESNPRIADSKDAQPTSQRIRVLTKA